MKPSIRQLEHLLAVREHGSFSRAAEECLITQSSLSASIKELESLLGQRLINRNRTRATLTPFGAEVADSAEDILEKTAHIMTRAHMLDKPMSGPLRLGIIPTIAPYILPDLLPTLTRKYPNLELQLHEDLTDNLLESLRKNRIDLALMAFPYKTEALAQETLFEEPFYAAVPHGSIDANTIKMNDLEPEKLLLLEDGHCLRDHALEACKLQLPRQRQTFKASALPTLIEMVRHGYGITFLPEMACQSLPKGIDALPITGRPVPTRKIGLCWNPQSPRQADYKTIGMDIAKLHTKDLTFIM